MSASILSLRKGVKGRIDMTGVLPEVLAGKGGAAVGRMTVALDGRPVELGELFAVKPGQTDTVVVQSEGGCLDNLGTGMGAGTLITEGAAGRYAGRNMRGGEVVIEGDAGDCAASGMAGGMLSIRGSAGDWLGSALVGERAGMAGGVVAVAGDVGARAGNRMRRGLILVGGNAGDACGANLLAGTMVVAGQCGIKAGIGMRRGTLILCGHSAGLSSGFNDSGICSLNYLDLLRRYADKALPGVAPRSSRVRRFMGDMAMGGHGEILLPA